MKHAVTTLLYQGYCLTCIYSCRKFYCPKVRKSWVTGALKSFISKSWYYFGNIFNSWKFSRLNDVKYLFEQIVGYNVWKLTLSRSYFTTLWLKILWQKKTVFFSELFFLLFITSMVWMISLMTPNVQAIMATLVWIYNQLQLYQKQNLLCKHILAKVLSKTHILNFLQTFILKDYKKSAQNVNFQIFHWISLIKL